MSIDTSTRPDMTPEGMHQANLDLVRAAMPTLRDLHDHDNVMSGELPADHSHFPGMPAFIEPYKNRLHDPPRLGTWRIEAGSAGHDTHLLGRLETKPVAGGGIDYSFKIKDLNVEGGFRPANLTEEEQLSSLLRMLG